MKRTALPHLPLFLAVILTFTHVSHAQLIAGPGVSDASPSQPVSNHTFSFSGTIPGQLNGALSVTFSIYPDQQSATALWTETQVVQITSEKYTVMLGSTSPTGLPADIFSADQAHWLGVQVNGSEKRFLLVSVPYAMKAVEAERLGGLLPSEYVTVQQLQSALQSATPGTSTPTKTTSTGPTGQAALAGTPPQPATDFTDNNTSEVLLVTQQGTGFAIHAITSSQAEAILAQNDSIGGTALHAFATNATGTSIGVLAETASPNGIAGVFNNQTGGRILSLRNNGLEVASVDANGNVVANGQVQASNFVGSGSGLLNIPPAAINATFSNVANSVVARDSNGSFNANQIFANAFSGSGAGLFNIPPSAVNATSINIANTVVARDGIGNFNANQIFANAFSGSGAGLFNIPPSAVNATSINIPNSVVARDGVGSFNANEIFANTFSGSGAGLFNIPPSAVNATSINIANSVVARDASGSFNANEIFANTFFGNGSGLFNVPTSALNASTTPTANSLVLRDNGGGLSAGTIFAGNLLVNAFNSTAIQGSAAGNAVGIQASTQDGIGLWAGTTGTDFRSTSLLLTNSASGKLISGGPGSSTNINETFSVSASGDIGFEGAMTTPYDILGTWIPSSLVKLTSIPGNSGAGTVTLTSPGDTSGAIGVAFGTGTFSRVQVVQSGQTFCGFDGPANVGDYVGISKTVAGNCADIGASFPTDGQQVVGRVLSPFVSGTARILLFQSELHSTAGGPVTINTGAGLTGGPITSSGTISVADGGITAAKLAPNAVTSANIANGSITNAQLAANAVTSVNLAPNAVTGVSIADGTLSPAKITGTAATLGANTFSGNQIVQGSIASSSLATGPLSATSGLFAGGGSSDNQVSIKQAGAGAALVVASNGIGLAGPTTAFSASSVEGDAIDAQTTFNYAVRATSTNGIGVSATGGNIGLSSAGTNFGVTANGATALVASGTNTGLSASASAVNGVSVTMSTGNSGKFLSGSSSAGQPLVTETFNVDAFGNIFSAGALSVPLSNNSFGTSAGLLARMDVSGSVQHTLTTDTSGIIGVAMGNVGVLGKAQIAYSGVVGCAFDTSTVAGDYVVNSSTSAGFCSDGGSAYPVGVQVVGRILRSSTTPATVPILLSVSNGSLSSINTGAGLTGGPITSSGTISIANAGVTNSMLQNSSVTVSPGVGLNGGGAVPLGGSVTLNNTGALSFNGRSGNILAAPGDYSFSQIAGTAGASQLPSATVYNNQSNTFTTDQAIQGNLATSGNINAVGSVTANAFTGPSANFSGAATPTNSVLAVNDTGVSGSAISVNSANNPAALFISSGPTVFMAGKITGATTILSSNGDLTLNGTAHASAFSGDGSALTNVSAAKIGTLSQADIATNTALSAETTARQSADTTLQSNITAETAARQTDIANVQASIGAESQARQSVEASLFSSLSAETTARQSDVSNLQTSINNVSAADAKLAASNTFTSGTQDFSGAGATLPVHSVLTANTPTACVASKELLIKTDAPAGQQLFICDDTGTTWNLVGDGAANGVSSFNGRNGSVTPASGDYSFAQISGAAASSQLPLSVVYNNQANSFTGNQTVNGAVTATSFSGSGSSLTGINAATLNGLASGSFAQLAAANAFTARQTLAASTTTSASLNVPAGSAPAIPAAGDIWNTGSTLQYRDNASTTRSLVSTTQGGGLQLLKLTASISPASVGTQACTEQSFTVAGISTGDVLLGVAQPSTASPGINIAIGGFRVSAANTVAIQFCNVSRNNSTPNSGVYTFAFMR